MWRRDGIVNLEAPEPQTCEAGLSSAMVLIFAVASGLAVANVYFAHPLLDIIAEDLRLPSSKVGLVVALTQVGYGLGLVLLAPLGDLMDRRKLVVGQSFLLAVSLFVVASSSTGAMLLASMAVMGFLAVLTQAFVAYSASLAAPAKRGRVIGTVTSGIVLGILLARLVSGSLADVAGWRAVYLVSGTLVFALTLILWRVLPPEPSRSKEKSYIRTLVSLVGLFASEPTLRIRAVLAMFIFADISILLTPLVLPLSAPPYSLSHTAIGAFGLAGAAGALGAARAGRWADEGFAQRTTGVALAMMLVAWLPIGLLPHSILWLIAGVLILDFGLQAVHVTNQGMIYRVRPEAQSRLTAVYMVFYAIGSALGASSSTFVYTHAGWTGVSLLGATVSTGAILFWLATLKATPAIATHRLV